eukprot:Tamp_33063.p2 GENE.Tamp_33063~~Tamp_33063.p2  ORF type:complete len:108 (+),score=4.31 Tamp_33063:314-637(+)
MDGESARSAILQSTGLSLPARQAVPGAAAPVAQPRVTRVDPHDVVQASLFIAGKPPHQQAFEHPAIHADPYEHASHSAQGELVRSTRAKRSRGATADWRLPFMSLLP